MRRTGQARTTVCVFAAFVLLVTVASCRQVVGVADRDPPCAPPAFARESCGECVAASCCVELDACRADASCDALLRCLAPCADDACRSACRASSKAGPSSAALLACQAGRCGDACGLACGGAGVPVTGCNACADPCCADGTAFRASVDGQLLIGCRTACAAGDTACTERCVNEHAEGAHLERAASECVTSACNITGNWACIGKVDARPQPTAPFSLSIQTHDSQTQQLLGGVRVRACSKDDIDHCENAPFGQGVTSATEGVATFVVTPGAFGIAAPYPGPVEITRDDYYPLLLWFDPPLTTDVHIGLDLFSTALLENELGTIDPTLGAAGAVVVDCHNTGAIGASLHVSSATGSSRTAYVRDPSAAGQVFDFAAKTTTITGRGVVFDVPPGPTEISARLEALCLDVAKTTVVVKKGAASLVILGPLPLSPSR